MLIKNQGFRNLNKKTGKAVVEGRQLPPGHPPLAPRRVGILLLNLGTPEATDFWSMRRYLKEFLSDRRVIETNPALWWLILNGIILNTRPQKSGHAYDKIWNRELNESPLKTITRSQAEKLAQLLDRPDEVVVDWAMRYGLPTPHEKLAALQAQGCDRILLFPLYPQYSAATTATALDKVYDALKTMRWQPSVRVVPPYYADAPHIDALEASLRQHLAGLEWQPDVIALSFHGLPKEYLEKGDPYYCHSMKTARLLRTRLGLTEKQMPVVFQSRFGKAEWLQPYAQQTVEAWPGQGVKNVVMMMPGFSSDCVETLEEVAIGLKETFLEKGGEEFSTVSCLNDGEGSIRMLAEIAGRELAGWQ
jgi:ferrochelatase